MAGSDLLAGVFLATDPRAPHGSVGAFSAVCAQSVPDSYGGGGEHRAM